MMNFLLTITFVVTFVFSAFGQRAECFPFEKLSPEKRKKAEEILLKALDSEALYTIVGGLKPMSSGFASYQFTIREPRGITEVEASELLQKYPTEDSRKSLPDAEKRKVTTVDNFVKRKKTVQEIDETRKILAHFRCGDNLFADLHHFAETFEGKRFTETVIFNRNSLRKMLVEKSNFFVRFGITENSHPLEVLFAVEYNKTGARFGGYGYLFGYPDYAVHFFVQASDEEEFSGKFVERDFYSIPTFSNPTNRFVYAVPKGHIENETDKLLKAHALKVFEEYKTRREKYIGEGKKGVVEMMRDWLCLGEGKCSTSIK
jgi:hypothetical protein